MRGDPTWLHQLFANLIHNALQYTPEGGRVTVEARPASGEVLVRVRDTGPGMSEADRAIAFSRFERGSASATGEGLGLGLALAREIARAHGGSIEIESPAGGGAVFAVRLPLAGGLTLEDRPATASPRLDAHPSRCSSLAYVDELVLQNGRVQDASFERVVEVAAPRARKARLHGRCRRAQ